MTTCEVFYWSDYSRNPVVSPVIVPGTGSSTSSSSSSSSGATIAVPSGNNAEGEGRRLLQNTCGNFRLRMSVAYQTAWGALQHALASPIAHCNMLFSLRCTHDETCRTCSTLSDAPCWWCLTQG